jgi:transposase
MRREGKSGSAIARDVGVSRDTMYRYLRMDNLSPKMPGKGSRKSTLDPYRSLIESWLDEDRRC